jgi:hypothetical protein
LAGRRFVEGFRKFVVARFTTEGLQCFNDTLLPFRTLEQTWVGVYEFENSLNGSLPA